MTDEDIRQVQAEIRARIEVSHKETDGVAEGATEGCREGE